MTEDFAADAFNYLLDDMDVGDRRAFEGRLARFPAARVALIECSDALTMLRRQAADIPFFGRMMDFDLHPLAATATKTGRNDSRRGASKPPHGAARHV
jgi:hypothetical protein